MGYLSLPKIWQMSLTQAPTMLLNQLYINWDLSYPGCEYCPDIYTVNEVKPANTSKNKTKGRKKKKKKCSAVKTMFFILSIVYLLIILCSPYFFDRLYDVNTLFCKEGFYDSDPTDESIKCKG